MASSFSLLRCTGYEQRPALNGFSNQINKIVLQIHFIHYLVNRIIFKKAYNKLLQ